MIFNSTSPRPGCRLVLGRKNDFSAALLLAAAPAAGRQSKCFVFHFCSAQLNRIHSSRSFTRARAHFRFQSAARAREKLRRAGDRGRGGPTNPRREMNEDEAAAEGERERSVRPESRRFVYYIPDVKCIIHRSQASARRIRCRQ